MLRLKLIYVGKRGPWQISDQVASLIDLQIYHEALFHHNGFFLLNFMQ